MVFGDQIVFSFDFVGFKRSYDLMGKLISFYHGGDTFDFYFLDFMTHCIVGVGSLYGVVTESGAAKTVSVLNIKFIFSCSRINIIILPLKFPTSQTCHHSPSSAEFGQILFRPVDNQVRHLR